MEKIVKFECPWTDCTSRTALLIKKTHNQKILKCTKCKRIFYEIENI